MPQLYMRVLSPCTCSPEELIGEELLWRNPIFGTIETLVVITYTKAVEEFTLFRKRATEGSPVVVFYASHEQMYTWFGVRVREIQYTKEEQIIMKINQSYQRQRENGILL